MQLDVELYQPARAVPTTAAPKATQPPAFTILLEAAPVVEEFSGAEEVIPGDSEKSPASCPVTYWTPRVEREIVSEVF